MGWLVGELGKAASEAVQENNPVNEFCADGDREEQRPLGSGGVGLTSTPLGKGVSTACR